MEKTIIEWLQELPEPHKTQAIKNTPASKKDYFSKGLALALSSAFVFASTPEGHQYWQELCDSLAPLGMPDQPVKIEQNINQEKETRRQASITADVILGEWEKDKEPVYEHGSENNRESDLHYEENLKRFDKQARRVVAAMRSGEKITCRRAMIDFGVGHFPSCVRNLIRAGVSIQNKWIEVTNADGKTKVKEYFIEKPAIV